MSRVLPKRSATASTASSTFLFACLGSPTGPSSASLTSAIRVPPPPEVFGRELVAHDPLDVVINVPGLHVAHFTCVVLVLEDLVTRQAYALLDHPAQPAIRDNLPMGLAPLAAVLERHGVAIYAQVLASDGRYAVRLVLPRVAFVANPEVGRVHQPCHRSENLLGAKLLVPHVVVVFRISGSASAKRSTRSNFSRSLCSLYFAL